MSDKSNITVRIAGLDYVLKSDRNEDYVQGLAESVDQRIREVRERNPSYPSGKVATLVAMQLLDELTRLQRQYEQLVTELRELKL